MTPNHEALFFQIEGAADLLADAETKADAMRVAQELRALADQCAKLAEDLPEQQP